MSLVLDPAFVMFLFHFSDRVTPQKVIQAGLSEMQIKGGYRHGLR
jgi:hypothetical protein